MTLGLFLLFFFPFYFLHKAAVPPCGTAAPEMLMMPI